MVAVVCEFPRKLLDIRFGSLLSRLPETAGESIPEIGPDRARKSYYISRVDADLLEQRGGLARSATCLAMRYRLTEVVWRFILLAPLHVE